MSESDRPTSGRPEERVDLTGLTRLSDRPPPPKSERAIRVARGVSVLLLAIAAAGLPWYFVTRSGKVQPGPARSPSPTTSASPSPSPTPSSTPALFVIADNVKCLHIRPAPSTAGKFIDCLTPGVRVRSDGQTTTAEGRLWRRVYDPFKKAWGWAAADYLKAVA